MKPADLFNDGKSGNPSGGAAMRCFRLHSEAQQNRLEIIQSPTESGLCVTASAEKINRAPRSVLRVPEFAGQKVMTKFIHLARRFLKPRIHFLTYADPYYRIVQSFDTSGVGPVATVQYFWPPNEDCIP